MRERSTAHAGKAALSLLGAAGFASVASTRLCDAMLPALAQTFRTTTQEAAGTISAYAVAYSVMQLLCGPLGDHYGKLRMIGLAAVLCAITTTCATLAPSMQTLVFARAAMGAGTAAIVPLTIAWIGDTVPLAQRQQMLARYSGFTVCGMVLGPLLGGLMTQVLSWRAAFALLAPLFAFVAFTMLRRSPTGVKGAVPVPGEPRLPYLHQLGGLLRLARTRLVLFGACAETAFGIAPLAYVPTILHDRFGLSPLHGGAIVALFGIGGFAFSRAAASLLRRGGPAGMPGIGGALLAVALLLLAWMPHWSWAMLACALAGFGFFGLHNTLQVRATQLSSASMGLAVSLFSCCVFIGQSIGVLIGAYTFTRYAPGWSFGVAAAGALLLGLGLRRAVQREADASAR